MIADMKIVPVRAFRDNYIWLLTQGRYAAVVDPGDAVPVLTYLEVHGLTLCAILVTHKHDDHVGGVQDLLAHRQVPVYAPRQERLAFAYNDVGEGDRVSLPEINIEFDVFDVPGHTARHVAYYGGNSLFCGDTLFGCGCGRVFDGTCNQLFDSLQKLASLPYETNMYCAHEYTLANIEFAISIDPDNPALAERQRNDIARSSSGIATLPSTIALELATNPFLRCHTQAVREAARKHGIESIENQAIFCAIRELKNHY